MAFITIPAQNIPVKYKTQVAVLGGGPSGISASVSAAKNGVDVILIERYGFLGGQATGGLVIVLCGLNDRKERIIRGYCQDVIDYLEVSKALEPWMGSYIFEPEVLKCYFDQQIIENNIKLLLHTLIVDVIVQNNNIKYIIVETKSGRFAIEAEVVIDCTGDADSLKWTNEDFEQQFKDKLRPVTACFRVGGVDITLAKEHIKKNKETYVKIFKDFKLQINPMNWFTAANDNLVWFDMSHIYNIDATDVEDLTKAEIETRELSWKLFNAFKKNVKGFDKSFMIDIAPLLGVRDSRRLLGEYYITKADYGKSFDDCVCFIPYYYDQAGVGRLQVPYRALVPKRIKNLLIAGRAISIDHKLIDCMREIAQCFATGQAAGVAASLAIKNKAGVKSINIQELREILISQGAYI